MENYKSNNEYPMWDFINKLDLYDVCNTLPDDKIVQHIIDSALSEAQTYSDINLLYDAQRFVNDKRKYLSGVLRTYYRLDNRSINVEDLDTISAYIVGLGKNVYQMVVENPELEKYVKRIPPFNFEFVLDEAINQSSNSK